MSPHIDLLGRLSVGYRDDAACLDAVAERKRRKRVEEMQNTRITIRGVRIARRVAAGWPQMYGLVCVVVKFCFAKGEVCYASAQGEADVVRLRQPHELNAGRQDERRKIVSDTRETARAKTNR
jgi:hypothetical protein